MINTKDKDIEKLEKDIADLQDNIKLHKESNIIDHKHGSIGLPKLDAQTRALLEQLLPYLPITPGTPSGAILGFGGNLAPNGYLLCDGFSYLRTDYPTLFAVIGTAFGAADSTHFNTPDLRGQFLRGRDNNLGIDPDRAARTALKPGGNVGDLVGSSQTTATKLPTTPFSMNTSTDSPDHAHYTSTGIESQGHTHVEYAQSSWHTPGSSPYYIVYTDTAGWGVIALPGGPTGGESASHYHAGWSGGVSVNHTHSAASWSGGDKESRPPNVYVNFIIKI